MLNFDLATVPFSCYGAYLAFDYLPALTTRPAGVYLRTLHGDALRREIFRCEIMRDQCAVVTTFSAAPSHLRWQSGADFIEISFADPNTVRMRGRGLALHLLFTPQLYDHAVKRAQGWQLNLFSNRLNFALLTSTGEITVMAPQREESAESLQVVCRPDASGSFDIALREFQSTWPCCAEVFAQSFRACKQTLAQQFTSWLQHAPSVPAAYAASRELAAYIQWSSVVAAQGHFRRPAMLMSKHWLCAVWSWDHCFNAMALIDSDPQLAWDQMMLPFDRQDNYGALPDCVNDKNIVWNFCKPPIQGWALLWMLRRSTAIGVAQLREMYAPLCRWTEWWCTHRDDDGDGLPQYNHGNDSGWDNSTLFDAGGPVQSPDLAAYLILQMQCLGEIAQRLNKSAAAKKWQQRAARLVQKLLAHYRRCNEWSAPLSDTHTAHHSASLLLCMPIVIAQQLPPDLLAVFIAALGDPQRFLSAYGLASESFNSPHYRADSYWRGPIWAPAVLMAVDGLVAAGESTLARDIAQRFCTTIQQHGFFENFDAKTGVGLRDSAHTWTASVFLLLAHNYLE